MIFLKEEEYETDSQTKKKTHPKVMHIDKESNYANIAKDTEVFEKLLYFVLLCF